MRIKDKIHVSKLVIHRKNKRKCQNHPLGTSPRAWGGRQGENYREEERGVEKTQRKKDTKGVTRTLKNEGYVS